MIGKIVLFVYISSEIFMHMKFWGVERSMIRPKMGVIGGQSICQFILDAAIWASIWLWW